MTNVVKHVYNYDTIIVNNPKCIFVINQYLWLLQMIGIVS
jgi:hypothetical protein